MNDVSVKKSYIASPYTDYVQSANTLFHFMDKPEYLINILKNQAIIPRYCIEDIRYLNIEIEGYKYDKIAVLQKCFCDIPLHKLTEPLKLYIAEKNLTESEKMEYVYCNGHPDFYGKYGIAFSKKWCEDNKLQPVQYINEKSDYAEKFSETFRELLNESNLRDTYADDILRRICYIKPLRGNMVKSLKNEKNSSQEREYLKNFHDEQEWRYIPENKPLSELSDSNLNPIIANPNILKSYHFINQALMSDKYKDLWLKFKYDDIRYIIVPDKESKINLIEVIEDIPYFETIMNRYILISKILVLDEIRKDL